MTGTFYNPREMEKNDALRICSITLTAEYTRIDFMYCSYNKYMKDEWISLPTDIFIQINDTPLKYRLIKAIGIPIAPRKRFFKSPNEIFTFSLFFQALPPDSLSLDVIEIDYPFGTFNFFRVEYSKWSTIPQAIDLPLSAN